jgi:hypothetical protein
MTLPSAIGGGITKRFGLTATLMPKLTEISKIVLLAPNHEGLAV